jgi:hypothetical protein
MKRFIFASFVCAAVFLSSTPFSTAQERPVRGKPGDSHQMGPDKKTRELFYSNLAKYLKLSEPVSRRFKPLFEEYGESRGKLFKESMDLVHTIIGKVEDDSIPVAELKTLSERYKAVNRSLWREREQFLRRASEMLDERQMVKLTVYEEKMKADLFKKFRDRRGDGRQRPDAAPPGNFKLNPIQTPR